MLLSLVQVFEKKSVFYINFHNDSATLTAKLQKNWLHIILVKFPELIFFLIALLAIFFIKFLNEKAIQNLSGTMFLANMCQKRKYRKYWEKILA